MDGDPENTETIRQARSVLEPTPNNKFLWMRPGLARYNMLSDSGRVKKFWKKRITPPVTLAEAEPQRIAQLVQNRVFHTGYFNNTVTHDTVFVSRRKVILEYQVSAGKPYRLGKVQYPNTSDRLGKAIRATAENSILKQGDVYSLEKMKEERRRIDRELKEKGYINFNPDFLILRGDSSSGDHVVNVKIEVKPDTPPESKISYRISKIFLFDDYRLRDYRPDTVDANPYYHITQFGNLRFDILKNGIFLKPDSLYSQSLHNQTGRYFNNLPIYRFANIKFQPGATPETLDMFLYLTQRKRFSYSAEFNTIFRSTNYFGPGVIFSFQDRNPKGGAELFKFNLRGRFEMQIAEGVVNPAYELGVEVGYELPRFRPAFLGNLAKYQLPKTVFSAGYNLFNRLDLYRLNSTFFDFGYRWSANDKIRHSFDPFELIYTRVPESSKSDKFTEYLEQNPGVRRSFEEQFVVGAGYNITYQPESKGRHSFFFNGGIDASGNLLAGLFRTFGASKNADDQYTVFGLPFSQYVRIRSDFRYGYNFSDKNSVDMRFVAGLGLPYSNSVVLPYVKQFFVGGTNSLRSFLARSVGPGSEVPPEGFTDLTGDIRLEFNLEYRFTIYNNFKGALFLDAGNIWLVNEDDSRPNAHFRADSFLGELAVSGGYGIRWDFNYVVARLDFGYTLRTPYLPEGERWTRELNLLNPVWNIAIGYPF